ncbi:hypothetical protein ABW20_dc0104431 [Dactylellina cionopaga]|nr:hypothetical protein ABW20_dc0104431 [Dactylellina cionopaga]
MPITWTHENVSRLFLITLAVHHIHMDYKQIAAAFGGDASPRAIEEKMKKLRKEAREFGDGSIDFLVNRGRKDGGGKSGANGKGGIGKAGRNGKGRARPVKYENGKIKWEYDNCEDDSEGESNTSPRGYGDLMECYLMKQENKVEGREGGDMAAGSGEINAPPDGYYMVDPVFTTRDYNHGDEIVGAEHEQQLHMDTDDIGSVMDPMLTNGMSNMGFQPAAVIAANGLHVAGEVSAMAWEHNQDLRDLNDEFAAISQPQLMEPGCEMQIHAEDHEINDLQRGGVEEANSNDADIGRVTSEEMDSRQND